MTAPPIRGHREVLVAGNAVGAMVIAVAWTGSSEAAALTDQIEWLNLAVVGLLIGVATDVTFLLILRRAIGNRRRSLVPDLSPQPDAPHTPDRWLWIPRTARAHVPGCVLVAGKTTQLLGPAEIRAEQLQRCELCCPTGTAS